MTREEAIRILSQYDVSAIQFYETDGREISWNKGHEALDVAISALEQPEIIKCEECIWWNRGNCYSEDVYVESLEYMDGDLRTEPDHFCGYAKRREE